jgi:hypothetical protein
VRSRSAAKSGKTNGPRPPWDGAVQRLGLDGAPRFCSVCGQPQWWESEANPQPTCANGHGGADDVGPVAAEAARARTVVGVATDLAKDAIVRSVVNAAGSVEEAQRAEVERLSAELKHELEPPAHEPPANPLAFKNVNAIRRKPLRVDLLRVVETVFVKDIHAEWQDLVAGLEIGEKRSEHGVAVRELDKAAARAYRAHRVYLTARAAREAWEADNEVAFAAMMSAAYKSLQDEKDGGRRNKAITDQDVRFRCAAMYPDQWPAQEERRRNVELTVKSLEALAEIWAAKQQDLRANVGKIR